MQFILNERVWIEDLVRRLYIGKHPAYTLSVYAKYLYMRGKGTAEIRRTLEDFVIRCHPKAQLSRWRDKVESAVKSANARPLYEVDSIRITEAEIEAVQKMKGTMQQRVLFTMIVLAKFRNIVRGNDSNWINYTLNDIFELANVHTTSTRQAGIIHALYKAGAVTFNRVIASDSIRVLVVNDDSEAALVITDPRNLGNQYLNHLRGGYIECERCGAMIRKKSNRQKFCKICAEIINREKCLQRYYESTAS